MKQDEQCDCHGDSCDCEGSCGCECCGESGFQRRFQTRAEQIAALESYLAELKLELQAVEEHLQDLKK